MPCWCFMHSKFSFLIFITDSLCFKHTFRFFDIQSWSLWYNPWSNSLTESSITVNITGFISWLPYVISLFLKKNHYSTSYIWPIILFISLLFKLTIYSLFRLHLLLHFSLNNNIRVLHCLQFISRSFLF